MATPTLLSTGGGGAPAPAAQPSPYLGGGFGSYNPGIPTFQPGAIDFSGNPGNLSVDYANAYNSAASYNQQLGNNISNLYGSTATNLANALSGTQTGYNNLKNSVLGGIQGITASQQQVINDQYAQQAGQQNQQLIDRGLGNTTIQQGVDRGLMLDKQKAGVALANQQAALNAQYESQLGLAGLGFQNQAAMENAGQANTQAAWMNTISAPYPDASTYAQLAQMYGNQQQAAADRALQSSLASQMRAASQPSRPGGYGGAPLGSSPFGPNSIYPAQASLDLMPSGGGYNPGGASAASWNVAPPGTQYLGESSPMDVFSPEAGADYSRYNEADYSNLYADQG